MIVKKISNLTELFELLSDKCAISIYGAGRVAHALIASLISYNDNIFDSIERIIVSEKKHNPNTIMGINVYALDEVTGGGDRIDVVIVAVFEQYQANIVECLNKCKIKEVYLLDMIVYREMVRLVKSSEIDIIGTVLDIKRETQRNSMETQRNSMDSKDIKRELISVKNYEREIIWAMNFNNLLNESRWCLKRDFAPTGMAVGYYYLYILYKALDSGKFDSFLDIGMGQTTKLFSQYSKSISSSLVVVESDKEWVDFFENNIDIHSANVLLLQCEMKIEDSNMVRVYTGFYDTLKNQKFDIISVDGPYGGDMSDKSRIDILSILPNCLKESWIILVDDLSRVGETNTFYEILTILDDSKIEYSYAIHHGANSFGIITSIDNRYFCKV